MVLQVQTNTEIREKRGIYQMKIYGTSLITFVILMVLKTAGAVDWPWKIITLPLWAGTLVEVITVMIAAVVVSKGKGDASGQ